MEDSDSMFFRFKRNIEIPTKPGAVIKPNNVADKIPSSFPVIDIFRLIFMNPLLCISCNILLYATNVKVMIVNNKNR